MACLDNIIEINRTDCIGNSRETINQNFQNLKSYACSLKAGQDSTESKTINDVPLYGIIMYYGDITLGGTDFYPNGRGRETKNLQSYAICNGNNGTPDMRDRFVVGSGMNYQHRTYGPSPVTNDNSTLSLQFSSVRLTVDEMPTHNHSITEPNAGQGHKHKWGHPGKSATPVGIFGIEGGFAKEGEASYNLDTSYATTDITIDNKGGSLKHGNRPPYIALGYIMRVAST